jgi:hypothetical protein
VAAASLQQGGQGRVPGAAPGQVQRPSCADMLGLETRETVRLGACKGLALPLQRGAVGGAYRRRASASKAAGPRVAHARATASSGSGHDSCHMSRSPPAGQKVRKERESPDREQ